MKFKNLFVLIGAICLTACNGDYIKCSSLQVGSYSFSTREETYYLVAKYKTESSVDYSTLGADGNYYIYAFLSFYKGDKEPTFTSKATVSSYYYGSVEATLVYSIGKYASYSTVSYSKSKKSVKYEEIRFKPISVANHDKEIQGQAVAQVYANTGTNILTIDSYSVTSFVTNEKVTYLDIGSETVIYTPYSNK